MLFPVVWRSLISRPIVHDIALPNGLRLIYIDDEYSFAKYISFDSPRRGKTGGIVSFMIRGIDDSTIEILKREIN